MASAAKHIVFRLIVVSLALGTATAAAGASKPPIAGRDVFTGKQLSLAQYRGKPVFVNVWGSWCGGCNTEARRLTAFARAHERQVAFIGIDTMDSRTGARAFYKRYDTDYPSIWDPRGVLAGSWARGVPSTLVFDRSHRLVTTIEGAASAAQLRGALRRVIRR
jgi:cytochrome c biogenesis protein CcmG, thiol:disulfide interchange protein DsbE